MPPKRQARMKGLRTWNRTCTVRRPVRPMRRRRPACLLLVALALAACTAPLGPAADSPDESATPEASRPVRSQPEVPTVPASDEPVTGEVPAEVLAELVADAAERTGIDPDAVEVLQAVTVTWNDGSLGCPERGMTYTMALVDGYHVILAADGEEFDYRVTGQGGFRLCEDGGRPSG
jgi:hypothetical protein